MNYELAKELKDAGFPQPIEAGGSFINDREQIVERVNIWSMPSAYIPTLSELLEALGDNFIQMGHHKGTWMTNYHKPDGDRELHCIYESTPERAISRLWLIFNKK